RYCVASSNDQGRSRPDNSAHSGLLRKGTCWRHAELLVRRSIVGEEARTFGHECRCEIRGRHAASGSKVEPSADSGCYQSDVGATACGGASCTRKAGTNECRACVRIARSPRAKEWWQRL